MSAGVDDESSFVRACVGDDGTVAGSVCGSGPEELDCGVRRVAGVRGCVFVGGIFGAWDCRAVCGIGGATDPADFRSRDGCDAEDCDFLRASRKRAVVGEFAAECVGVSAREVVADQSAAARAGMLRLGKQ